MNKTIKNLVLKVVSYNSVRKILKTVDPNEYLFSYAPIKTSDYIVEQEEYAFKFYGMEQKLGHKVMNGFIRQCLTYIEPYKLQREYIIDGGKCYIEPKYGWGIRYGSNQLIKDSVIYNRHMENYFPSFFHYKTLKQKNTKYFPKVVSIRMIKGAEKNYWHFLSDMLGIIVLIDQHNFPADIPLVITKELADKKFFQQVVAFSPKLQKRNWVIQDKEYILADQVFFCQKMPNHKSQLEGLLNMLDIPDSEKSKNRKVYVKRSPERIRFIKNSEEIEAVVTRHGFEIIDCDNLAFSEQVKLFSECSHIIGIHGAGLTNIIWRKNAPMKVLELFPVNYVHPGYFWIAKAFEKDYLALTGGEILPDSSFYLDSAQFEEKIVQMINS
jgi:hypothetical protein